MFVRHIDVTHETLNFPLAASYAECRKSYCWINLNAGVATALVDSPALAVFLWWRVLLVSAPIVIDI
jgi:hypothetical protein